MNDKITVGEYLLQRLAELGIGDIFGVPGDFSIDLVGMIDDDPRFNWIGDCNELNAGYAADGYARINGIGVLCTTFGPGELSAVNAVAGAYSEHVPLIKIVGAPAVAKIQQKLPLHHCLLNGKYDQSYQIYQQITTASACLDFNNPGEVIDQVIGQCLAKKLPVYIQLPQDVLVHKVSRPQRPLMLEKPAEIPERELISLVEWISNARQPVILIGELIARYDLSSELQQFLHDSGYPYVVSWGAKGVVNENAANFCGMYAGIFSSAAMREYVESSDCVVSLGWLECEVNLGMFSARINPANRISIAAEQVIINGQPLVNIDFPTVIRQLIVGLPRYRVELPRYNPHHDNKNWLLSSTEIGHENLIYRLSQFLNSEDILVLETGTIGFTGGYYHLPDNVRIVSSINWYSIGYALGATTGVCLAHGKNSGRVILVVGDGSLQMTVQAISTLLRYQLKPIILVLNNGGYTIERVFLGENAAYNDVPNWDYLALPKTFGGKEYNSFQVQDDAELVGALVAAREDDRLAIIEVMMDKHKQPEALQKLIALRARCQ